MNDKICRALPNWADPEVGQGLYDIACALRGPDAYLPWLKHAFTARLRVLAGVPNTRGADTRTVQLSQWDARHTLQEVKGTDPALLSHYLNHVQAAATALGDEGLRTLAYKFLGGAPLPDVETIACLAGGD